VGPVLGMMLGTLLGAGHDTERYVASAAIMMIPLATRWPASAFAPNKVMSHLSVCCITDKLGTGDGGVLGPMVEPSKLAGTEPGPSLGAGNFVGGSEALLLGF
jgi:hypothetical protein